MPQTTRGHALPGALAFAAPRCSTKFIDEFNGFCEKDVDAFETVMMTLQAALAKIMRRKAT